MRIGTTIGTAALFIANGLVGTATMAAPMEVHLDFDRSDYIALEPVRLYVTLTAPEGAPCRIEAPEDSAAGLITVYAIASDGRVTPTAHMAMFDAGTAWSSDDGPAQETHWFDAGLAPGAHRFVAMVEVIGEDGYTEVHQSAAFDLTVAMPEDADAEAYDFLTSNAPLTIEDGSEFAAGAPASWGLFFGTRDPDAIDRYAAFVARFGTSRYADYVRFTMGTNADASACDDLDAMTAIIDGAPADFPLLPQAYRQVMAMQADLGNTEAAAALATRFRRAGLQMKSMAPADRALADLLEAAEATAAADTD